MNETVIIIPSRISAKRLPNKPLKLINNKEMILHVFDRAKSSAADKVLVATPDKVIFDLAIVHFSIFLLTLKFSLETPDLSVF